MDHLKDYRNTALFPLQATNAQKRVVKDILSGLFNDKTLIAQALEYITGHPGEPTPDEYFALLAWMNPQDASWEGGEEVVTLDKDAIRIIMAAPALLMEQRGQLTLF
jgi:hypothetical protein